MRTFLASLFALTAAHRVFQNVETHEVVLAKEGAQELEEKDRAKQEVDANGDTMAHEVDDTMAHEVTMDVEDAHFQEPRQPRQARQTKSGVHFDEPLQPVQPPKQYGFTELTPLSDFMGGMSATLAPDITPGANETLIFNVREHKKFAHGSEYSWEVVGRNRRPFSSPVLLGRFNSKNAFTYALGFQSAVGQTAAELKWSTNDVFDLKRKRLARWRRGEGTYFVENSNNRGTYYTIEKTKWKRSHHSPENGYRYRYGKDQEYINIYTGRCRRRCNQPTYTGSGHRHGLSFTFFHNSNSHSVCRVDRKEMEHLEHGSLGRKEEFLVTVQPNADAALLLSAVTIMDELNNRERESNLGVEY